MSFKPAGPEEYARVLNAVARQPGFQPEPPVTIAIDLRNLSATTLRQVMSDLAARGLADEARVIDDHLRRREATRPLLSF